MWKTEDMPVDSEGNRADVIMDAESIIKRMNLGCVYEQFYNACSRDVTKRVRTMFGLPPVAEKGESVPSSLFTEALVAQAWEYLLGYYKIISPKMFDLMTSPEYKGTPRTHVESVVKQGVYIWLPTDNPASDVETVKLLKQHYPPHIGPVTYRGRSGRLVTTKNDILIGSIYMILLEKTGSDWSGVSSAKLQHFGIPAKLTKFDKFATPGRAQPVRMLGETEVRLVSAAAGSDTVADLIDQSNNPTVHKEILSNIYKADKPSNIPEVIDRKRYPVGNGRNLVFIRHIMQCAGSEFIYRPEEK